MTGPTAAPAHFPYAHRTMAEVMAREEAVFVDALIEQDNIAVAADLAGITQERGLWIFEQIASDMGELEA